MADSTLPPQVRFTAFPPPRRLTGEKALAWALGAFASSSLARERGREVCMRVCEREEDVYGLAI